MSRAQQGETGGVESMGLTSSKTIIPIKEADAKLGPVLRMRIDKVRVRNSASLCLWVMLLVCCSLVYWLAGAQNYIGSSALNPSSVAVVRHDYRSSFSSIIRVAI